VVAASDQAIARTARPAVVEIAGTGCTVIGTVVASGCMGPARSVWAEYSQEGGPVAAGKLVLTLRHHARDGVQVGAFRVGFGNSANMVSMMLRETWA
jgi:hypothetical protein